MATTKEVKEKAKAPPEMSNTRRIITLVAGDAIAFLVFAAIGRGSHGEATGLAAIPQIALTAAPFAAAWFIVAPFAGAYRRELTVEPRKMAIRTVLAWVFSWPVAMALRGIFVDHAVPPISFALITLIFNTLILLVWRWPYALNNSMKKRG
jgi:hypothetical protein